MVMEILALIKAYVFIYSGFFFLFVSYIIFSEAFTMLLYGSNTIIIYQLYCKC